MSKVPLQNIMTEVQIASDIDEQSIPAMLSLPAFFDINHAEPSRKVNDERFSGPSDVNWQNLSQSQGGFRSSDM